jgi:hypothetical protein
VTEMPSLPSFRSSYRYTLARMPKHTIAAHNAASAMTSGVPKTSGKARIDSRTLPLATTAGIRSQRSDQIRPGDIARATKVISLRAL